MKTYTIGNLKGGVGKTTSAVNLAYSMSYLGKRVLVIDLDPQTNLTPFFVKANASGHTVCDVLHRPEIIRSTIYRSKYKGIDIIKGNRNLKEKDAKSEHLLYEALKRIEDRYDICIIDTRPAFENLTRNAIYAADVLLVPVCLDRFGRDNLLLVEEQYQSMDLENTEMKIFANKVENKKSQRNTYIDMVQCHSWQFLDTCISNGAVAANALYLYKPIMKHRPGSQLSQDYLDLAKELLGEY